MLYLIVSVMLLLALFVGIFYAIKDRRRNDAKTYYFGGKDMLPVSVINFVQSVCQTCRVSENTVIVMKFPTA